MLQHVFDFCTTRRVKKKIRHLAFFLIKNWVFLISDYELCKITKRIGGKYHEFQPPLDLSKN